MIQPRLLLAANSSRENLHHADMMGRSPLHAAVEAGRLEIVRLLLEHNAPLDPMDKDQRTPLVVAAMLGHDEIVTILLSAGARDSTPALHAAAKGAFHEVVRLLLEARLFARKDFSTFFGQFLQLKVLSFFFFF